jgi:hypothetical protein
MHFTYLARFSPHLSSEEAYWAVDDTATSVSEQEAPGVRRDQVDC